MPRKVLSVTAGAAAAAFLLCALPAAAALPDLRVAVTDKPDPVAPLGRVTYTLTVRNTGAAPARNVRVVEKLPAVTRYVSSASKSGTCGKVNATTAGCTFPLIPAGGLARATVVARLVGGCAPLPATATVDPLHRIPESNEANNVGKARTACVDPCAVGCGAAELCDTAHLGLDDDCDGSVDEGCACVPGQAQDCFRGDPSHRDAPGCYAGSQHCSADGTWEACVGGVHATEGCFANDTTLCHPLTANPFATVNLADGTGAFSADALPGSESWTVACPDGVAPCPGVFGAEPPDDFQALQSGEYAVTYTKALAGGGTDSCTYPLFVRGRGLRVELQWEHDLGGTGVDLDLHVHQPGDTRPWSLSGAPQVCMWGNCAVSDFTSPPDPAAPDWFSGTAPPDPVDWFLDPVLEQNTCYDAPRGLGAIWQGEGRGCHNPRLDLDTIGCDPVLADPGAVDFCGPENVSIDYPPLALWTRLAVHYYGNRGQSYTVHPRVRVFCDGALSADLGPGGYFSPQVPVAFEAAGGGGTAAENLFWLPGDVAVTEICGRRRCTAVPLHADEAARTPLLTTGGAAESNFGPGYPGP